MTTFSESDIREAFQTFDRDGNGFIGTRPSISVLACAVPSSNVHGPHMPSRWCTYCRVRPRPRLPAARKCRCT